MEESPAKIFARLDEAYRRAVDAQEQARTEARYASDEVHRLDRLRSKAWSDLQSFMAVKINDLIDKPHTRLASGPVTIAPPGGAPIAQQQEAGDGRSTT